MIKYILNILIFFILLAMGGNAAAETSRQLAVGARAIAMGGAFVAVASDATAVSWNPAAIAALRRQEINYSPADRFGLGLKSNYLSYVLPLSDNQALGVDWLSSGFDDPELKFLQNKLDFAYGYRNNIQRLRPYLGSTAFGVTGKYIAQEVALDGTNIYSASGWGADLGLLAPLPYGLRLGATIQDFGDTFIEREGGGSEKLYLAKYRLGLAAKPIEGFTLAADLERLRHRLDMFHLGGEYWFRGQMALRAGLQTELETPESLADASTLSFGLGLKYRFAQLDYAYERHPILPPTHYFSAVLAYNPRVVSIKDALIRPSPIFRSLYQHYQENEFFHVNISNSSQDPIAATVSLMLPKVMSVPHQEEVVLPPQSTEQYSFKVTFDQALFNQPEAAYDNFVQPVVQVSYSLNRQEQVVEKQLDRVYVAGKGKLSWNKEGMAATFVTPEDMAVASMARGLVQRHDEVLTNKFNRSNIGKATLLFDAMGAYGLKYQRDAKTPFASISEDKTIFDTVQYPSELLEKSKDEKTKIGDCDDLTVLYASLLENLDIRTAFLEANDPGNGHIYLMFDSGIRPDRAVDHFDPAEYVEWQERVWIPVETTLFGDSFATAWGKGVREYKRLKVDNLIEEVSVQKYLQIYKPAVLPTISIELPPETGLDSLLSVDVQLYEEKVDRIAMGSSTAVDSPEGAYEAAFKYLNLDHLEKAMGMLDKALQMQPEYPDALNARGVVLTRQGRYQEALESYRLSLRLHDDNGVRMNIALTYYLMGERETADQLFDEVVALDDNYGELFDFLGTVGEAQEYYEVGVGYLRQLGLDQALEQFELALEADPRYVDALNAKGVIMARKHRYDDALMLYEKAVDEAPEQLGFQLNIALVHYLKGDHKKADVIYQRVIDQDPAYEGLLDFLADVESIEENYQMARSYLQQDKLGKALERLDKILKANPNEGHAHNTRGVILTRQGHYEDAYRAFERAEALRPRDAGIRLNMAIVRFLQGRLNEASLLYQQVIEMDSRYEGMLDMLGKQ